MIIKWLCFVYPDAQLHSKGPPIIHANNSHIIQNEYQNLELRCTGSSTIDWSWPKDATERVEQRSIECPTCPVALQSTSTLKVSNASYKDTGFYRCFYSRFSDRLTPETSAEVYAYITSDGKSPMTYCLLWTWQALA